MLVFLFGRQPTGFRVRSRISDSWLCFRPMHHTLNLRGMPFCTAAGFNPVAVQLVRDGDVRFSLLTERED